MDNASTSATAPGFSATTPRFSAIVAGALCVALNELRLLEGWDREEMAAELGVSMATLERMLNRNAPRLPGNTHEFLRVYAALHRQGKIQVLNVLWDAEHPAYHQQQERK